MLFFEESEGSIRALYFTDIFNFQNHIHRHDLHILLNNFDFFPSLMISLKWYVPLLISFIYFQDVRIDSIFFTTNNTLRWESIWQLLQNEKTYVFSKPQCMLLRINFIWSTETKLYLWEFLFFFSFFQPNGGETNKREGQREKIAPNQRH